jgi:hypothetical protein
MTQLLGNPGMARRSSLSLAILIAIFAYGLWELWHAATVSNNPMDYLFGTLFIGGALYGARTALNETRDLVILLEADLESDAAAIELWRPFRRHRIDTTLEKITGWRHWIQTGPRGRNAHFLLFREPSHEGVLHAALTPGMTIPDELRRIAPEAIADFERATGAANVS